MAAKSRKASSSKSASRKSSSSSKANGKGGNGKALAVAAKAAVSRAKRANGASSRYSLLALRQEFDRIFEELSSSLSLDTLRDRAVEVEPFRRLQSALSLSMPAVDMVERPREYKLTAELPGMDRKDIDLTVSDDVITIKGEKRSDEKKQSKNYHLAERRYGAFERSFRLPEGASSDGIDASFRQGVLTITLPKTSNGKTRQRKISVRSS